MGKSETAAIIKGGLILRILFWASPKAARGLRRLMFRWRRVLSPLVFAGIVWLVSMIWANTFPAWCWLALLVPAGGGTIAWYGPKLNDKWSAIVTRVVPTGLDRGRSGVLDRPIERIYFAGLSVAIGGYLFIRSGWGGSDLTLWWWRSALVLFGGAWWYHRRVRMAGRGDKIAKKWGRLADPDRCPPQLKGLVRSRPIEVHGYGRRVTLMRVRLAEASTLAEVSRLTPALAAFYDMRPNAVHVRQEVSRAREVWFTFLARDPWGSTIPHPMPAPGSVSLKTCGQRIPLGLLADGTEQTWAVQHMGTYGETGGGKSAMVHSLIGSFAPMTDAMIVGIDMAGGATLADWQDCFVLPMATTLEGAVHVLERVFAFIEVREKILGLDEYDDDEIPPSDEQPWLFLIIDEFPDLLTAAKAAGKRDPGDPNSQSLFNYLNGLISRIGRKARKTGTKVLTFSQNATKDDNGSKEFQGQLTSTLSLRLSELQSRNLWGVNERLGWESRTLGNGHFRLKDADHTVPEVAKGFWTTRPQRRKYAKACAGLRKTAEPAAMAALLGLSAASMPGGVPVISGVNVDKLLASLRDNGPQTVPELVESTGISRSWVYKRLNGHGEAELVEKDGVVFRLTEKGRVFVGDSISA